MPGAGQEIPIPEALAERGGFAGHTQRALEITLFEGHLGRRQQQVAALDAIEIVAIQQTARDGEPTRAPAHLTAEQQRETDPERTSCGARRLVGVQMRLVGALEYVGEPVVLARQICRNGEPLEIIGGQGLIAGCPVE